MIVLEMEDIKILLCCVSGLLSILFAWDIWMFRFKPILHPHDPKELPYWIPCISQELLSDRIRIVLTEHSRVRFVYYCIFTVVPSRQRAQHLSGHLVRFTKNSFSLLQEGRWVYPYISRHCGPSLTDTRRYFGNTGEPFALTIAGQSLYVVTSAKDIEELYRNKSTLSWEGFVQDLYRWIGFSDNAVKKLWQPPTEHAKTSNPVRVLSPNEMVAEYQRRQLRPGKNLESLAKSMIKHIDDLLRWQNLDVGQTRVLPCSDQWLTLSLIDWTSHTFIRSTTEAYWGKKLFEIDPDLLQTYNIWERTSWKYVFQIPRLFSQDMYNARDKLVDAFTAYFRLPQAERAETAWFVPIAEAEMRDIGLGERDLGRAHMLQHWA